MTPFPISLATPVSYPGPPPARADLVVVGGGVIGTCTALFAARRGLRVVLCEKGRVAGEQSGRNWGWIRRQGRDPHELPIMIEASRLWGELAGQTNVDIGLRHQAVTYLTRDAAEMERYHAWLSVAREHDVETQVLDAAQLAGAMPELVVPGVLGGMTTARDQRAEPWVAVPALAGIAAREGVQIVESCAVRALDISAGRISGVITEQGRIATSQVVVAGGAWSSLLLRAHGVSIPQLSVRATVAATAPVTLPHSGAVTDDRVAFRTREDGGLSIAAPAFHELFIGPDAFRHFGAYLPQLRADPWTTRFRLRAPKGYPDGWRTPRRWSADARSPFEDQRILNPSPNLPRLRQVVRRIEAMFPQSGPIELRSAWAGMIDTMPDVVPVVDQVDAIPGLIVGCGMSGHGFGIGPGMGRVLADMAAGNAPGHDLSRFRLSRFSDGSKMDPGPAL